MNDPVWAVAVLVLWVCIPAHSQNVCLDADGARTDLLDAQCVPYYDKSSWEEPQSFGVCTVDQQGAQHCTRSNDTAAMRRMMRDNGLLILVEAMSGAVAHELRDNISDALQPGHTRAVPMGPGFVMPCFHLRPEFYHLRWLIAYPPVLHVLRALAGSFRFVGQSELSFNDVRSWHQVCVHASDDLIV